jgi:hypothetical protein
MARRKHLLSLRSIHVLSLTTSAPLLYHLCSTSEPLLIHHLHTTTSTTPDARQGAQLPDNSKSLQSYGITTKSTVYLKLVSADEAALEGDGDDWNFGSERNGYPEAGFAGSMLLGGPVSPRNGGNGNGASGASAGSAGRMGSAADAAIVLDLDDDGDDVQTGGSSQPGSSQSSTSADAHLEPHLEPKRKRQKTADQQQQQHSSAQKSCPACTMLNQPSASLCKICQTPFTS